MPASLFFMNDETRKEVHRLLNKGTALDGQAVTNVSDVLDAWHILKTTSPTDAGDVEAKLSTQVSIVFSALQELSTTLSNDRWSALLNAFGHVVVDFSPEDFEEFVRINGVDEERNPAPSQETQLALARFTGAYKLSFILRDASIDDFESHLKSHGRLLKTMGEAAKSEWVKGMSTLTEIEILSNWPGGEVIHSYQVDRET